MDIADLVQAGGLKSLESDVFPAYPCFEAGYPRRPRVRVK